MKAMFYPRSGHPRIHDSPTIKAMRAHATKLGVDALIEVDTGRCYIKTSRDSHGWRRVDLETFTLRREGEPND